MARREYIGIRRLLNRLVPNKKLERLARRSGFTRRRRKIRVKDFFWSLVLGFATGEAKTLGGLRCAYLRVAPQRVSRSSFYKRFTPELVRFLRAVLDEVLKKAAAEVGPRMGGVVERFREVLLVDSTVIRLHRWLAKAYAGSRTNHSPAAAKLYLVMGVQAKGPHTVKVRPERVHDRRLLRIGPWVEGKLFLFDLGFYSYTLFANLGRFHGHFVSRLKKNANPRIVGVHRRHRGRAIDLVGKSLGEVRRRLKREVLDVEVEVSFRRRAYSGVRHGDTLELRLVGVLDAQTNEYHFYLTGVSPGELPAEEIARLYGIRWEIELVFRELKRCYRIDQIPSRRRDVVEALIYASILALVVSREILAAIRKRLGEDASRVPTERWARLFAACAVEILVVALDHPRHAREVARRIETFFRDEAPDPNRNRALLLDRTLRRAV